MALQHEDASSISFARSPILYALYESTFADAGFYYTCDVYVWQGLVGDKPGSATYSLKRFPTTNGTAVFNVQSLARDFFPVKEYSHSSYSDTQTMYSWLAVTINWTDDAGSGTPIVVDPIVVYDGYNLYLEGVNYVTPSHLGNGGAFEYPLRVGTDGGTVEAVSCIPHELLVSTNKGYWMTDRPLAMDIPPGKSMHQYLIKDATSLVNDVIIDINNGEEILTYGIQNGTTITSECAAIGVGSTEIYLAASKSITPTTWSVYGAKSDGTVITQTYVFTLVDECKWGSRNLQFINRYGVWDNIITTGKQTSGINVERSEILNNILDVSTTPAMSYDEEKGQFRSLAISGRFPLKVNTGWLTEDWNSVMEQFMLTESIYDPDTSSPFVLKTNSLTYKTSLNDKMINYEIDLESANTSINSVM